MVVWVALRLDIHHLLLMNASWQTMNSQRMDSRFDPIVNSDDHLIMFMNCINRMNRWFMILYVAAVHFRKTLRSMPSIKFELTFRPKCVYDGMDRLRIWFPGHVDHRGLFCMGTDQWLFISCGTYSNYQSHSQFDWWIRHEIRFSMF